MCLENKESLEHLFLLCPLAKAIWFIIDLLLQIESFAITSIKEWIFEWLSKQELASLEALWFYDQFVCTLLSLWKH